MDVTSELMGGHALLVRGNEVHCHEPLLERQFGILENCPNEAGEPLAAMAAFELVVTVGALIYVGAATERARHLAVPPLFCDEIPAPFVVVEVADERNQ